MSNILFLPRESKIHIFKPPCNVFFLLYRQKDSDKIIEMTQITSSINSRVRLWKITTRVPDVVFMNFTSGVFSSKTLVSI